MLCPKCGQQNAEDCLFCVSCGTKMEPTDEETIQVNLSPNSSREKTIFSDFTNTSQKSNSYPPEEEKIPPPKSPPPENRSYSSSSGSTGEAKTNNRSYSSSSGSTGEAKTNTLAIVSMVLSILSILSCCGTVVPLAGYVCLGAQLLVSIASIVTGIMARKQIARSNGTQKGDGFALAGMIIGIIFLILFGVWLVLTMLGLAANVIAYIATLFNSTPPTN